MIALVLILLLLLFLLLLSPLSLFLSYRAAIAFVVSATMGMSILPSPPAARGTRVHAACVSSVSVDAAITWQLSAAKSNSRPWPGIPTPVIVCLMTPWG